MNLLTKLASDVRERTEQLKLREYAMTEAVASAIGCPEWFDRTGCDGRGECYCLNAAQDVEKLSAKENERLRAVNADLLAALKELHEAVGRFGWAHCDPKPSERQRRADMMNRARSAIAKAEAVS
jgi:hypothetical protein